MLAMHMHASQRAKSKEQRAESEKDGKRRVESGEWSVESGEWKGKRVNRKKSAKEKANMQ